MAELVITIDGPSGSGKSSTAKLLAGKIGAAFLDTGAMYRAATLAAMEAKCELEDVSAVGRIIDSTDFRFEISSGKTTVKINGKDVTEKIRDPQITDNVRFIASASVLRERLVKMQQEFASQHKKIVTEGRDQGTVVFPDAQFKFFLTASSEARTHRRAAELAEKGFEFDRQKLQRQMEKRDDSDKSRKTAPLVPAEDAVIIDNTDLTLEQTVSSIMEVVKF